VPEPSSLDHLPPVLAIKSRSFYVLLYVS